MEKLRNIKGVSMKWNIFLFDYIKMFNKAIKSEYLQYEI